MNTTIFDAVFWSFFITSVIGCILKGGSIAYKMKCSRVTFCGLTVIRDIKAEEQIDKETDDKKVSNSESKSISNLVPNSESKTTQNSESKPTQNSESKTTQNSESKTTQNSESKYETIV